MARVAFLSLIVVVALVAPTAPALAQVLEILPDGQVRTYSGPAIYSTEGVRPLATASSAGPGGVAAAVAEAARRHQVPAELAQAVAWQESRFSQSAVSPKGARGVMQLMPATARDLGVDAADLASNIEGGVAYLAAMLRRFDGSLPLALAAYNAGPGAVERHGGVPPFAETQSYVRAILAGFAARGD